MTRSASCRRWSRSSRASIAPRACSSSLRNVTRRWRSLDSDFLRLQRLEQDDVAIEQPCHAAHQAIGEPQEDQRHARQPEDRQRHPDEPQRHAPDTDERPERPGWRARPDGGILQLFQGDLVKDEAKRERGHQVDQEVAGEIGHSVGSERQLESELEEEHRADRQVGPGEELVLPDREP